MWPPVPPARIITGRAVSWAALMTASRRSVRRATAGGWCRARRSPSLRPPALRSSAHGLLPARPAHPADRQPSIRLNR
ncbi:hypothetical protein G6F53_014289 [Rhizopus delemar]|nr:hypothetical protein G6F53_014289 [Rhizopus delemar]